MPFSRHYSITSFELKEFTTTVPGLTDSSGCIDAFRWDFHYGDTREVRQVPALASSDRTMGEKVHGRYFYIGKDRDTALAEYVRVKDDLEAGCEPRPKTDGVSVAAICNRFLTARRLDVDLGKLSGQMWAKYHRDCDRVVNMFGKSRIVSDLTPDDFGKLRANRAKTAGTNANAKLIRIVRTVFKFGYDEGLISVPILYGSRFTAPA